VSAPIHHDKDLDPALMYAPPRVRDQEQPAATESNAPPVDWPWRRRRDDNPDFDDEQPLTDMPLADMPHRLTLDPEWLPEPPPADDGHDLWKLTLRAAGVLGFAALVAWVVVSIPSARRFGHEALQANLSGAPAASDAERQAAAFPAATAMHQDRTDAQAAIVEKAVQQARNHVEGGGFAVASASASAGPAVPPRQALAVAARDEQPTMQPPIVQPAAPPVVVAARDPAPPQPAAAPMPQAQPAQAEPAPPAAAATQTAPANFVTRQLDRDEVVSLLKRGEDFINAGDLASARLLLRRAAEAGDMRAALMLASTFDPNVLRTLGVPELGADVAKARLWYERALQFGSTEAPRRLQELANVTNSTR
jgi:hypothetical protein